MIPFLSSRAGGFHERLIDVDDRAVPVKSIGEVAGPVITKDRRKERACRACNYVRPYCLHQVVQSEQQCMVQYQRSLLPQNTYKCSMDEGL